MEIVDMYYQHAILEPCNPSQWAFYKAGFWPYLTDHGLIYTVRYWPDNNQCDPEWRLLEGKDYGETMFHEEWLWPLSEEVRILARLLWEQAGCPTKRDLEFWLAAERLQAERRKPYGMKDCYVLYGTC